MFCPAGDLQIHLAQEEGSRAPREAHTSLLSRRGRRVSPGKAHGPRKEPADGEATGRQSRAQTFHDK